MELQFTVLGSGSAGNSTLIEAHGVKTLVDAGLSAQQITRRLEAIGRDIEAIDGILITHEHNDHTKGLKTLCKKHGIPVYANRLTLESIERTSPRPENAHVFETGSTFYIKDLRIETFSVPHDAYDPVGFVVNSSTKRIAILTDLGHIPTAVLRKVQDIDAAVIEANYDPELLENDPRRPWSIKQRIMSRHGHLSNAQAATLIEAISTPRLKSVALAHLSRDCNSHELARDVIRKKLPPDSTLEIAATTQEAPSGTIVLG